MNTLYLKLVSWITFYKNGISSASFSFIFGLFEQNLQQINVKNVHLVSGAGIRTRNPLIMSLLL